MQSNTQYESLVEREICSLAHLSSPPQVSVTSFDLVVKKIDVQSPRLRAEAVQV